MKFEKYIKQNKITKSIQLELQPIGKTRDTIKRDNTIEEDQERIKAAKKIKLVSDAFYREVLESFANEANYDWESLYNTYQNGEKKEYQEAANKMKEQIAHDLSSFTDLYIKQYVKANGENEAGCNMSSAKFVDVLLPCFALNNEEFQTDEIKTAFALTKGASSAIFKKYFIAYEKIISATGHGSVAARAIENFETVCMNIMNYQIAGKIEKSFEDYWELSDISIMNSLLSQKGINLYNELIGGSYDKEGNRIKDGFNVKANLYMQKNKDIHLYRMKKAKKQILTISEPAFKVDMIETKDDFNIALTDVIKIEEDCRKILEETIPKILVEYNKTTIYISPMMLNELSASYNEWNTLLTELKEWEIKKALADYLSNTGRVKKIFQKKKRKKQRKKCLKIHIQ